MMRQLLLALTLLLSGQLTPGPASLPDLAGTTSAIGGSLLAVIGNVASGTATVAGATVGMPCVAQATDGTNMTAIGGVVTCTVTSANTVTVNVVALIAFTPASKTYAVRVLQ